MQVQSVTGVGVLISPSDPSVRHWERLWSSAVKGEGDSVGVVLFHPCRPAAPLDCGSSPQ